MYAISGYTIFKKIIRYSCIKRIFSVAVGVEKVKVIIDLLPHTYNMRAYADELLYERLFFPALFSFKTIVCVNYFSSINN